MVVLTTERCRVQKEKTQNKKKFSKNLPTFFGQHVCVCVCLCVATTYLHSCSFSAFLIRKHSHVHTHTHTRRRYGERIFEPLDFHIFRRFKFYRIRFVDFVLCVCVCVCLVSVGDAIVRTRTFTYETILPMCMTNAMCWNVFYW